MTHGTETKDAGVTAAHKKIQECGQNSKLKDEL